MTNVSVNKKIRTAVSIAIFPPEDAAVPISCTSFYIIEYKFKPN
jgi:hypothetical protein